MFLGKLLVRHTINISFLLTVSITLASCFGSKPVSYFNGNLDTTRIDLVNIPEQIIQKGDILNITVYSDNPEATAIFNQAGGTPAPAPSTVGVSKSITTGITGSSNASSGYLVDNQGNIRMHQLGGIKAEGLTKERLSTYITSQLNTLGVLQNPYCVIRHSNFKVTVLGEVKSPGVFTLPGEKASILDALGLAGDINDYGLKGKVILIRESEGKRTYREINLLDPATLQAELFYLRQNDIILVQADKRKPTAFDLQTLQYVTIGATVVSSIAILLTLFK
jgi:polysaccharide export outer membrane protein